VKRLRQMAAGALCATAVMLPILGAGAAQATSVASPTPLTLKNGWTNAPFGTSNAAVSTVSGIVHFKGAIATTGTNPVAFTLPKAFRPATAVYVPVDLCDAANGRLFIQPSGVVSVEAEQHFSDAACFTSLDGAQFAKTSTSFTALTLKNGWTNAPSGTSNAAVRDINGVVYFKGAIATTGTSAAPFALPKAFRPATEVFVKVDLCNANNGRLDIAPTGVVTVVAEGNTFSHASCFTSLDGASFATSPQFYTNLTLKNGWTGAPFGTSKPAVHGSNGVVTFKGAIATTGSNPIAFTLPSAFRPATTVYVPVDTCNANNGRLVILHTGVVSVEAEGGTFANPACFTSLDGVSFMP
jgi:hypothetical protein